MLEIRIAMMICAVAVAMAVAVAVAVVPRSPCLSSRFNGSDAIR